MKLSVYLVTSAFLAFIMYQAVALPHAPLALSGITVGDNTVIGRDGRKNDFLGRAENAFIARAVYTRGRDVQENGFIARGD